ncbi:uncharacterized protein [Hetaerina americana]|uniref:uncharacterized protein n=1 Tax=Hetaerina americana TaxID=62018 RepID=UPI003A7F5D2B
MDRLLLEWILRHAMKYSYFRVIKEIHRGCPDIKYEPYLEKFVLYATCSKLCSFKNHMNFEHRKMLWYALQQFVDTYSQVHGNSETILCQYYQMILILKWIIAVETTVRKHHGSISQEAIATLEAHKTIFTKKWNTISENSSIPCNEVFNEMELKLAKKCSSVINVCEKLIDKMSVYVTLNLENCLEIMKSHLPSTAIEEMQSREVDYCLEETKVLPSDPLEIFTYISAKIKKDPSEKGLLSIVQLIVSKIPTGLLVNVKNGNLSLHQTLDEMNSDAAKMVETYTQRIKHYRSLLAAIQLLSQTSSNDSSQSRDDDKTTVSNEAGEVLVGFNGEEAVSTQEGGVGEHSTGRKPLCSQGAVQFIQSAVARQMILGRDTDDLGSNGAPKKKLAVSGENSNRTSEGLVKQNHELGSVSNSPRVSPRRVYNIRQRKAEESDNERSFTKKLKGSPNTTISPARRVSPRTGRREGCSISKGTLGQNVFFLQFEQKGLNPALKEMDDDCVVMDVPESEIQFPYSLDSISQSSETSDSIVGINIEAQEVLTRTSDCISWDEGEEVCSVTSVAMDELKFSCTPCSSISNSEVSSQVQEMDVDVQSSKHSAESDGKVEKRKRRSRRLLKAMGDVKSDDLWEKVQNVSNSISRSAEIRNGIRVMDAKEEEGVTKTVDCISGDEGEEICSVSHVTIDDVKFSCTPCSSSSDSAVSNKVAEMDVEILSSKHRANSDGKVEEMKKRLNKSVEASGDVKSDKVPEKHKISKPYATRSFAARKLFSNDSQGRMSSVIPKNEDKEGSIVSTLSRNELYFSCDSGDESQETKS